LEEIMKPIGISQNALARVLKVPPKRINEIVHGNRSITVDTASRLSKHFGTSVQPKVKKKDHIRPSGAPFAGSEVEITPRSDRTLRKLGDRTPRPAANSSFFIAARNISLDT